MAKYIDADLLHKEIERRRLSNCYIDTEDYEAELYEIIDSLQQKQPSLSSADKFAILYDQGTCDGIAQDCFKAGAGFAVQQIISLIESRIAEILGDAQPAPVLRIELQELIDKIKEESK